MKSKNSIISIIIPVYNVEEYIVECLQSVVTQDILLEILLIDDCCTDNSISVAKSYLDAQSPLQSKQWKIIKHEKNRGLSAARNTGINAASGKYIYFLDSDDYLPTNSLKNLMERAESENTIVTIGNIELATGGSWQIQLRTDHHYAGNEVLETYLSREWYEMAWNKLILRQYLIKNKLYFIEGIIHEDDVWSLRLACLKPSLACVQQETYFYRNDRVGSIMYQLRNYDYLKASLNRLISLNHCIDVLEEFDLLNNWLAQHNLIQRIQLDYLFVMPKKNRLKWIEKMTHYAYFSKYYNPVLRKRSEQKFDWHFRAIGLICYLSPYIASVVLQVYLILWRIRPGARLLAVLSGLK